jgi:hypothetical protein
VTGVQTCALPIYVRISSAKYGYSRIFNAKQAYDDADASYDVAGKPDTKAFKFKYTPVNGMAVDVTVVVGK